MKTSKLLTMFAVSISTQIGRGSDPLDIWTWRNPLPTGCAHYGIAYGSGQFVAVGFSGTIITSADGATWT